MSEIIDLDSNNLCTTEDAFEKFQAVSMYEEDEYITLSDIVSPPRSSNEISEILNEVAGDDVSVSLQDSGRTANLSSPLQENQVQLETPEYITTVEPNVINDTPKKRGRKKKNGFGKKFNQSKSVIKDSIDTPTTINSVKAYTTLPSNINSDSDLNYDMIIGEEKSEVVSVNAEEEITKQSRNTERKYYCSKTLEVKKDSNNKLLSKRGRPRKIKNKIDIDNTSPVADENKKVNRKGRKKKISDISTVPEPLTNNESILPLPKNDVNNELLLKKSKKKSLESILTTVEQEKAEDTSNDLKLKNIDPSEEDIPLVALSTKCKKIEESSVNNLELSVDVKQKSLNDLSATPIENSGFSTEKSPRKRGRPKKYNTDNKNTTEIKLNLDSKVCEQNISKYDEIDEVSLSMLKNEQEKSDTSKQLDNLDPKQSKIMQELKEENLPSDPVLKRNLKKPTMSDFEYNIDSIIKHDEKSETEHSDYIDSLMKESSRPVRRRAKKNFDYDEGSDEDPFANVELSDDDPPRRKKGSRYFSDDEYVPGHKRPQSDLSDSDIEEDFENIPKQKKKRAKKLDSGLPNRSPKKRGRKSNGEKINSQEDNTEQDSVEVDVDVEVCLDKSVIMSNEESPQTKVMEDNKTNPWAETNEFENFLAKIVQGTDIKIKKAKPIDNEKTSLQIPVLDATEVNKRVEMFTQTNITTKPVAVQTTTLYDIPMKNQIALTAEQSEKACEFLSGIVKTTSELGQLMTQKSEDFIEKKINTKYVTDTFKMDYCVKKSFLLFKLAKHNLVQMEEDLSKHYEEFLKANDLLKHREEQKIIPSTSKSHGDDSDCEIVEEPPVKKEKGKPAFNPKTVFLNKELSIKIAKKPAEKPKTKEKLNIKGRHTVWINDSIMVKKVKPNQSFLAQDSRNKKPPDTFVTLQMVSDFFKMYEYQKAVQACAPYIRNEWYYNKSYVCYYFFETATDFLESSQITQNEQIARDIPAVESEPNDLNKNKVPSESNQTCPESLCSICMQVLQKYMCLKSSITATTNQELNLQKANYLNNYENTNINNQNVDTILRIWPLKTLCYKKIKGLIYDPNFNETETKADILIPNKMQNVSEKDYNITKMGEKSNNSVKSLFSLCVELIIPNLYKCEIVGKKSSLLYYNPYSLKNIVFETIKSIFHNNGTKSSLQEENIENKCEIKTLAQMCIDLIVSPTKDYRFFCTKDKKISQNYQLKSSVTSLRSLCLNKVMTLLNEYYEYENIQENIEESLNFTIDKVNTVSEDVFLEDIYQSDHENILQTDSYIDNEEHNFSDEDRISYDDEYREDDNNWVSQVQMQELRSCTDSTITKDSEKGQHLEIQGCLLNIKIEPLEDVPESIVDSSTIKNEPLDVDETNFTPLDVITKQENMVCTSSNKEPIQRQNSNSYDVDSFEAFVRSNKMILSMCNDENEEIFSQSSSRVRRQYEPDYDNGIETFTDTMNLLVPQNVEKAKDRLMESSDEDGSKKKDNKKLEKRKIKPKKTKKDLLQPFKEKQVQKNDVAILTRRMRDKIRQEEKKLQSSDSELEDMTLNLRKDKGNKDRCKKNQTHNNVSPEKEIQCNDVDSTEKNDENEVDKKENQENKNVKEGISKIPFDNESEQNLISNADSIEPDNVEEQSVSLLIKLDEPIELIECQPTIPLLENDIEDTKNQDETSPFIDRHGWKCYPIDGKDSKIYQCAYVSLDKLPESFVETYFRYQDVADKDQDDAEVDKLINLNSLHRAPHTQTKDKTCGEVKESKQNSNEHMKVNVSQENLQSSVKLEPCDELSPSEDEREDFEDNVIESNVIASLPEQSSDNCLAKDSLMDDDSDSEKLQDDAKNLTTETKVDDEIYHKTRSGRLVKSKYKNKVKSEDLMLTADKMMNKELTLLHAPVELKEEYEDKKDNIIRPTRNTLKTPIKGQTKKEPKEEDDSSSEEEKQWFTTKEKLLKRLQKKQEIPNVDDAKRAKIVSEFIEKRGDGIDTRQRGRPRRRSKKKLLERRKQMKILSMELFGEDSSHTGKKYSQASSRKGRRNIRKVLDKKSLGRSTVLANMEEFERKQRLSQRQMQLREVLGCEEGVNVVVINDELCLEYDFEELRPIVSVHPFFTKVMKAHQYEGVKFMWDACFESVSAVASGAGGGCILAHCMGLGKTLQVLALLHTVLTHPKVEMRRVLVCCPLSTVLNWVDEINKWIGPVTNKIKVFELSKLKKTYERAYQLEDWYNGGGIFIIGYELFRSLTTLDPMLDNVRPTIVNKIRMALLDPGPDMIICDEGHLLKNDCSVLAVAMSRVVTKRRIILTGTPMQNNLREYYCMVNFVKPNLLGTYSEYSNRFENPIMNGQHRDSREEDIKLMKARTHILHKVLEGCLQRQEASVLYPYLPKKHEYTVFISLTQCQRELYNHYLLNYSKETKQSVLKDFHVFQKIWTHPQVLHNFLTRAREDERDNKIKVEKLEDDLAREDLGASEDVKPGTTDTWWLPHVAGDALSALSSSNKFLVVFRLLDECVALGDKVLIFSTSLYTMDALEYFLRARAWALGREYYRLDGSVPAEVRQKWCREFNAPNNTTTKLFLISTRAGCLGLNMTAANRVIILDTSWNPAHDIQSIFRVYRFGQKKDCYIYRLVAMGTMEQKIYERSVTKQAVACRVVDEQQIDRHYNMSDLSELYKLDEAGSGVSAGLAAGVRDAALLRVARADEAGAALHAVHEHDSLLRGSGESGLPEHERAAAWMQFQQEHAATHIKIQNIEIKNNKILSKKETRTQEGADKPKSTPEEKSKRGKRSTTKSINPEPSTSRQSDCTLDPEAEESVIKKIMEILIKHNFHTTKTPQEISDLVVNVRNVVGNARKDGLDNVNPLTASIAKVLLESDNIPLPEPKTKNPNVDESRCKETEPTEMIIGMPYDEGISSAFENNEQQGTIEQECFERKRRRQRRISDDEYVPEPRYRKKNVVSNEKPKTRKSNENSLSISSDDNSLNASEIYQTEVQKTVPFKTEISEPIEPQLVNNSVTSKQTVGKELTNEEVIKAGSHKTSEPASVEQIKVTNNRVEESILLSDDDDEPLATIKPGNKVTMLPDNSKETKENNEENDEPVPLHKSLLTNKNFIKIVAHTYLSGNPMLDEDAAILAAQYSTLKALKEMNATGKAVTSGPIYDIAVQVLGKGLLKKLQNVRVNSKDISKTIELESFNKQNDVPATSTELGLKTSTTSETKMLNINEKKQMTKQNNLLENSLRVYEDKDIEEDRSTNSIQMPESVTTAVPISVTSASQNVVPVGMFKGPASFHTNNLPSSQDECILPDDDDVVMTSLNPQPTPNTPTIPQNNISRRNSKRLVIKAVLSDNNKTTQNSKCDVITQPTNLIAAKQMHTSLVAKRPSTSTVLTNTSTANRRVQNTEVTEGTLKQKIVSKQRSLLKKPVESTKLNETICLDSDEDDVASNAINVIKPVRKAFKSTTKPPITAAPRTIIKKRSTLTKTEIPTTSPSIINSTFDSNKRIIIVPVSTLENSNGSTVLPADSMIKLLNTPKHSINSLRLSPTTAEGNTAARSQKINHKTNCKPGDIIRITESGKIEVLRRTENIPASIASLTNEMQSQSSAVPDYITGDNHMESQNVSENCSEIPDPSINHMLLTERKLQKTTEDTKKISLMEKNTRNVQSKSKSTDPLSVLQDVIHIPADKYEESIVKTNTKSENSASKTSVSITKDKISKRVKITAQEKNVTKHDLSSLKNKTDLSTVNIVSLNASPSTSKQEDDVKVIDLTENYPVKNNVEKKKVIIKKKDFVAIAGTSKDIIINKMGVLLNNSKSNAANELRNICSNNKTAVKKNITLTFQKVSTNDSVKRPSAWQEQPVKKSKPNTTKPMTLKDFNIDDFDDIIELE